MSVSSLPPGHTLPTTLNGPQREAVLYLNGPCLVLAGAGSGKTRVITQKIAYLLRECGYTGRQVVALTFTNKAAREMSERVRELVEPRLSKGLTISTFHSLGLRFLREEAQAVGLKPAFSIVDATDALAIVQELLATTDKARLREVQQTISLWKNALMDPDAAEKSAQTPGQAEAARVYRSYDATLQAYQSVDFDDLIRLPTMLLIRDETVRARWQARVKYLLIDEYQDTNVCQYRLVQALVGDRAMFTAVGDDDQAIYAWRGATVENLTQLTRDYPSLKLIKLEQNYRSVQRILSAANQVIGHNPNVFDKKLWSDLGVGEPIRVTSMDNDQVEAESVAMRISAERFERQAQWRDFAILYRSNQQARIVEQALRNLRIPYTISGGQSFFDKTEIRDVLSYLRLWPTTTTTRPSSEPSPRPSGAWGKPLCRRWASSRRSKSCPCSPPCSKSARPNAWRRASWSLCRCSPPTYSACSKRRPSRTAGRRRARRWWTCWKPSNTNAICTTPGKNARRRRAGKT